MRASRLCQLIGIALLVSCGKLAGQETALLVPGSKVVVPGSHAAPFMDPVRCDDDGDLYFKWLDSATVTKISSDGQQTARFSLDSVPDPQVKRGRFYSYALNGEGELFALVRTQRQSLVVSFDKEGKYEGTVALKAPAVFPYRLAVFPTGEFLLAGVMPAKEGSLAGEAPYTAIFDAQGELVKRLSLTQDNASKATSAEGKRKVTGERAGEDSDFESVIGGGDVTIGPDGYAYLTRNSASPIVYVISSQGTVIRRMVLHAPAGGLRPIGAPLTAPGELVVPFGKGISGRTLRRPELYSVYNAQTGDHVIDYEASPDLSGGMLCYAHDAFIFVGGQDGHMALISATPR
jgi:hypothetical protein